MWKLLSSCFALVLALIAPNCGAASVHEESGVIVYADDAGRTTQLKEGGKDSQPVLSPDGRQVAFLRRVGAAVDGAEEIWLWRVGDAAPRRLLAVRSDPSPRHNLENFNTLLFSADGTSLYFLCHAWVTSDALHALDLKSGRERYVIDANDVLLGPRADRKELLIVMRHKYPRSGGGATDDYWLVTLKGKEIQRIGADEEAVKAYLHKHQANNNR
jgi:hypothetical protein